jgi:hypothetical protein
MCAALAGEEAPQRDGNGEDHVEVRNRQQVLKLSLGLQFLVEAAIARVVLVAAGVVGVVAAS